VQKPRGAALGANQSSLWSRSRMRGICSKRGEAYGKSETLLAATLPRSRGRWPGNERRKLPHDSYCVDPC
jgi:hypothetical protein